MSLKRFSLRGLPGKSGVVVTMLLLGACEAQPKAPENTGSAQIALTNVPAGVLCLRVTAAGTRTVESSFDVASGQSSVFVMNGLALGTTQFIGAAFGSSCANLGAGAIPAWSGDPVQAEILAGQVALVTINLRQNGKSIVTVNFVTDPVTGAPCVGTQAGCLDPQNGIPASALPPEAKLIDAGEFGRRLALGTLVPVGPQLSAQTDATLAANEQQDRAFVQLMLGSDPVLMQRALSAPVEDDRLQMLGDGNYLFTLSPDANGVTRKVVTMGQRTKLAELAGSLRRFRTQANQFTIYNSFYPSLPDAYRTQRQLPPPEKVQSFPADSLYELNLSLVNDRSLIDLVLQSVLDLPPPGHPANCGAEIGTPPSPSDQTGTHVPSPGGIWSNTKFPLKWRTTCVKDQANRGTCTSFGITSAIEAKYALNHSSWRNLSEERLYFWAEVPRQCGDGLGPTGTLSQMIGTAFTYPFETDWDYNPSYSRPYYSCPYVNSCIGYTGEHCSDTTHQGDLHCYFDPIVDKWFCATDGSAPPSSAVQATFSGSLWFPSAPSASVAWGIIALALNGSLVLSMDVTDSFDSGGANGIATFGGPGEHVRGGHTVHVVGFVDNARLPSGVPPGSGGGYYIVKNSWGRNWGDGGYVYLPYDTVATYGHALLNVDTN